MRTIHHDSDGWPRPLRAPLYAAAPFASSSPGRVRARRALLLFMTAGTWAAGLCLVVGSVVLVASQAKPGRLAQISAASSTRADAGQRRAPAAHAPLQVTSRPSPSPARAGRPARHSHAQTGRPAGSADVIAVFSGDGNQTTRTFDTRASAAWQIQWSYTCPAAIRVGLFVVEDAGPGATGASISQSAAAGHGATWLNPSGSAHELIVISTCSWTMKVTQHR